MANQDSYVQVATDGTGKKVDNATLTREKPDSAWSSTSGDTIYRQRVVLGADDNPKQQVKVEGEEGRGYLMVGGKSLEGIETTLNEIRDLLRLAIGA